ncbi:MAG: DUF4956 domain-containing protein [Treponema sp.]|jgi:hypothetical protein|nr:DUF4956 domain-containing protein [Treponema sp.]
MFENVLGPVDMSLQGMVVCVLLSLVLGVLTGMVHTFRNSTNKNFVITLAVLPFIVQAVILVVNDNIGTGIAVMGAFSLVRFRSFPGTAREIAGIFLSMAIGLLTGAGYALFALIFTLVANGMIMLFVVLRFGEGESRLRYLKITIPEDLDYAQVFQDLFARYTVRTSLEQVRTTNMGSLYELRYLVALRDENQEKAFLDQIRMRNSNLYINCTRTKTFISEEL